MKFDKLVEFLETLRNEAYRIWNKDNLDEYQSQYYYAKYTGFQCVIEILNEFKVVNKQALELIDMHLMKSVKCRIDSFAGTTEKVYYSSISAALSVAYDICKGCEINETEQLRKKAY